MAESREDVARTMAVEVALSVSTYVPVTFFGKMARQTTREVAAGRSARRESVPTNEAAGHRR
jgi:hypothetical protein